LSQSCRNAYHAKNRQNYAILLRKFMPALPSWYLRLPDILDELRSPVAPPFLDRPAIEKLFRVGRRQAIRLLGVAKGYQIGKTFLVSRESLAEYLERIEKSGASGQARARKERVLSALNEVANHAAAQRVHIRVEADVFRRRPSDLPDGIELVAPGRLQISYQGAEDLLAHIVELASRATNDFDAFRKLYEGRR
jgi:hypothetical protein